MRALLGTLEVCDLFSRPLGGLLNYSLCYTSLVPLHTTNTVMYWSWVTELGRAFESCFTSLGELVRKTGKRLISHVLVSNEIRLYPVTEATTSISGNWLLSTWVQRVQIRTLLGGFNWQANGTSYLYFFANVHVHCDHGGPGIEPGSSAMAVRCFNYWAMSTPKILSLFTASGHLL